MPETITLKDLERLEVLAERANRYRKASQDAVFINVTRRAVPAMAATLREAMRLLEAIGVCCGRCHGAGFVILRTGSRLEAANEDEDRLRNTLRVDCPKCKNAPQQARDLVRRFKREATNER